MKYDLKTGCPRMLRCLRNAIGLIEQKKELKELLFLANYFYHSFVMSSRGAAIYSSISSPSKYS